MIYEPNTTRWAVGDYVIHDADAKKEDMLMVVTGYRPTGECCTVYVDFFDSAKGPWVNDIKHLHDPARFGIKTPKKDKHHD